MIRSARFFLLGLLPALALACGSPRTAEDEPRLSPGIDREAAAASSARHAIPAEVDVLNFTPMSVRVAGGGPPTPAQVAEMPAKGYSTIIDLRTDAEPGVEAEAAAAERAGLHYVRVPVSGNTLSLAKAQEVLAALEAAPPGDVLLHCASGNRAGAMWGLVQALDEGVSENEAVDAAYRAGMRSPGLERAMRATIPDPRDVARR